MLIRVLEIPPPTGKFHFSEGEKQIFVEVDWFRDDPNPLKEDSESLMPTAEGREKITAFIKAKKYYDPSKAYLVLHSTHTFTINYRFI